MKLTRRNMLAGSLLAGAMSVPGAAPAAASGLSGWQWRHGHGAVLLFDPDLPQARAFAEVGRAWNRQVSAIDGDRIRFAREVFDSRPAIVQGVSRQADAVLIEDVAAEAGYERTALEVDGDVLKWTLMPRIRARD